MSTATLPQTLTGTYVLDPGHSRVGFVARHAMVTKVRGSFRDVEASGFFNEDDPTTSEMSLTIQAKSVDTRNEDRDSHLRSNDFFDMENHPTIEFTSTGIEKVDESTFRVTGDLTVKGTSKPITVDMEMTGPAIDPWDNVRIGLEGRTTVNRKDWGLNWNAPLAAGGVLVGEKVTLEFEASAIRQDEDA
jgi:polyisoprenoid-binding protein YceI